MPLLSTTDVVDFAGQTLVNRAVSAGITASIGYALMPAQLAIDLGIAAASTGITFLIMTTAKLAIGGAVYVGAKTYKGVMHYFYQPLPQPAITAPQDPKDLSRTNSSAWDLTDRPLEDSP